MVRFNYVNFCTLSKCLPAWRVTSLRETRAGNNSTRIISWCMFEASPRELPVPGALTNIFFLFLFPHIKPCEPFGTTCFLMDLLILTFTLMLVSNWCLKATCVCVLFAVLWPDEINFCDEVMVFWRNAVDLTGCVLRQVKKLWNSNLSYNKSESH